MRTLTSPNPAPSVGHHRLEPFIPGRWNAEGQGRSLGRAPYLPQLTPDQVVRVRCAAAQSHPSVAQPCDLQVAEDVPAVSRSDSRGEGRVDRVGANLGFQAYEDMGHCVESICRNLTGCASFQTFFRQLFRVSIQGDSSGKLNVALNGSQLANPSVVGIVHSITVVQRAEVLALGNSPERNAL